MMMSMPENPSYMAVSMIKLTELPVKCPFAKIQEQSGLSSSPESQVQVFKTKNRDRLSFQVSNGTGTFASVSSDIPFHYYHDFSISRSIIKTRLLC